MKQARILLGSSLIALLLAAALATSACGQQPIYLRAVDPSSGRPGQELALTLRGGGFSGAQQVWVIIGDLEVWDVLVASDQVIRARLAIPESTAPGPRTVEVVALFGQNEEFVAVLEGGFTVLELEEPPGPEPTPLPGDGPGERWWLIPVVAVVALAGAALAVTVALKLRRSAFQKQWQEKAQEQEPPETCQAGTYYVRREDVEIEPGRWQVAGLKVTLYDAAGGRRGSEHEPPPALVDRLDEAARLRLLHGEEEAVTQEAGEIARELISLVTAWQSRSEAGRDVYLEACLEGGEASATFTLYRCVGKPGRWQEVADWTAELEAVDRFPTSLRGPAPGETPQAYRALLQEHLGGYIHRLIEEAGRLL